MLKENPEVPKHLMDEIDSIGSGVFAELGADQIEKELSKNELIKELVIDLLNRIVAPSRADAELDKIREELAASATSILRKMGFPIDDYDSLLGTHNTAFVADKLIEDKKDDA